MELLQLSPAALQKPNALGSSLLLPELQAGELAKGLRTYSSVGEYLKYNYFPVWGLPTQEVWDLIILHILGHIYWQFPVFFINYCSAVLCDLGVLMGGHELKILYSALFSYRV